MSHLLNFQEQHIEKAMIWANDIILFPIYSEMLGQNDDLS